MLTISTKQKNQDRTHRSADIANYRYRPAFSMSTSDSSNNEVVEFFYSLYFVILLKGLIYKFVRVFSKLFFFN